MWNALVYRSLPDKDTTGVQPFSLTSKVIVCLKREEGWFGGLPLPSPPSLGPPHPSLSPLPKQIGRCKKIQLHIKCKCVSLCVRHTGGVECVVMWSVTLQSTPMIFMVSKTLEKNRPELHCTQVIFPSRPTLITKNRQSTSSQRGECSPELRCWG